MIDLNNEGSFLFYNGSDGKVKAQVILGDETVWLTQKGMSGAFDTTRENVTMHLSNIFKEGELNENSVCKEILHTAADGKTYRTKFYNLDAIIAVGYRISSYKATQFRMWATQILKEYLIKGFVLDDERLKQGNKLFGKDYFKELLERIREIRASERLFYEKITDLYATSVDYDKNDPQTLKFFAKVQNKLIYAVSGQTAAEIINARANAELPNMGLQTWKNAKKEGKIQKSDVTVAKNYLNEDELRKLNTLVNMYLDYAELQAERNQLMKMADWNNKLNAFLQFNEYKVLDTFGDVSKDDANLHAQEEYIKFRVIQDKEYKSDFNKYIDTIRQTRQLPSEEEILTNKGQISSQDQEEGITKADFDKNLKGLLSVPPPKNDKEKGK